MSTRHALPSEHGGLPAPPQSTSVSVPSRTPGTLVGIAGSPELDWLPELPELPGVTPGGQPALVQEGSVPETALALPASLDDEQADAATTVASSVTNPRALSMRATRVPLAISMHSPTSPHAPEFAALRDACGEQVVAFLDIGAELRATVKS